MLREEAIARGVLFPYLEQERGFHQVSGDFWRKFLQGLLDYEKDQKQAYAALYGLEIKDPEKIIKLLPRIYDEFLEELAEQFVLGNAVGVVYSSGLLKNSRFREHLQFFKALQNAMTRLERKRMIEELPAAYAAISEELSDARLSAMITKVNREQLREKFERWEAEEEKEEELLMNEMMEFDFSASYHMKPPGRTQFISEKKLFAPPPVEKSKSSYKWTWILVVLLVVLIALSIWVLWD